jgi:DNA-binding NarL/FixJ family response regulator
MSTSVLLVDDQELLRMGFRMVLEAQSDLEVVGEAGDGQAAVALVRELDPDVVLMDVRMPTMDGVEATRVLADAGCRSRIIILTTFDLDEYAHAALRAGASGFLLKNTPPPDLLSAIRAVASGDAVVAPSTTRRLLEAMADQLPAGGPDAQSPPPEPAALSTLTPREREVLLLVASGLSNAEIAARLVLSDATVKTHVGRVLAKLALRDRVQIVVYAYDHGLVTPAPRAGG